MAKYEIACNICKENVTTIKLYGSLRSRQWKIDNYNWTCDSCLEKIKDDAFEKSIDFSKEYDLPKLNGSEKQIKWAETLRFNIISQIENNDGLDSFRVGGYEYKNNFDEIKMKVLDYIYTKEESSFWISNRNVPSIFLIYNLHKEILNEDCVIEKSLQNDFETERIISNENPITSTIAKITNTENVVRIEFTERNDIFKNVVKNKKYKWNSNDFCWERTFPIYLLPIEDRISEIALLLIKNCISVCVYDNNAYNKVKNNEFELECSRWVIYDNIYNCFIIKFNIEDKLYDVIKRIKGNKYINSTTFQFNKEYFNEVIEFADCYGFKFSKKALDLINVAKEMKEKSIKLNAKIKSEVYITNDIPCLKSEENINIPIELLDD